MEFDEFLRQVQERGTFGSPDEARRAVSATLETLRDSLANSSISSLPQEVQRILPPAMTKTSVGQWQPDLGRDQTNNPQIAGETRAASGGESTAESGQ